MLACCGNNNLKKQSENARKFTTALKAIDVLSSDNCN